MEKNLYKRFLKKLTGLDRFLFLIILLGATVAFISFFRGILVDRQNKVEYISGGDSGNKNNNPNLIVDIEGAVIAPGVYELSDGSRLKDVLVLAGGLADDADREFCEKNLNMAEVIKDGQKIYIPSVVDTNTSYGYNEANSVGNKVNINSASIAELDTLWGIGTARADSIVKNRPYQSIDELVTKGVLSKTIVDRNRDLMSVY